MIHSINRLSRITRRRVPAVAHKSFATIEVPDAYAAAIDRCNPLYKAYIHVADTPMGQKQEDDTPLYDFVLCVKDNIEVSGMPCSAGTAALKGFIPQVDALAVQRLLAAGARINGKVNLHELAYGATGNNHAFGATGNVMDASLISGGSSSGTAVAVALHMCRAGLGTDTGGSVRIPAALNGIVGFRPSTGRYPNDGIAMISPTRDTIGPMTKDVADTALLDSIMAADDSETTTFKPANAKSLRLGVPKAHFYENLEPCVAVALDKALATLRAAGVTLVEADIPEIATLNERVSFPVVLYETTQVLPPYLKKAGVLFEGDGGKESNGALSSMEDFLASIQSPDVTGLLKWAFGDGAIPKDVYEVAIQQDRPKLQEAYATYFEQHNVEAIIYPTTPLTARPIEGSLETVELNGKQVPTFATYIKNTDPSSNAGVPSISIPVGKTNEEDLHVGVCLDGPQGNDRRLLAIGALVEKLLEE